MKKGKIKLIDIAQQVGVSTATVSYVLNNHPMAARIGKEVKERIRLTAKALNYQPNQIAKSLRTQRTYTIGLIVADICNPFSAQIARIIEDTARQNGYTVILGSSDENIDKAQDLIDTMLNRQVDGLIITAIDGSEVQLIELKERGISFVLIDRYFPNRKFSYVGIDNFNAAFEAVNLLIENGRQRIGLITYQTSLFHLAERNRGYMEALKRSGINVNEAYIQTASLPNIRKEVEEGIDNMLNLNESIDALFFTTNVLALNGLRYLKNKGITTPNDVAVIAFDESDVYDFWPVSITHIRQPLEELGKKATEALIDKMGKNEDIVQLNLKSRLIIGKSSG